MPLKLVRRAGSPNWFIRGTVRGRSVFESVGTSQRAEAEAIRIRREAELLDRSVYGDRVVSTFTQALDIYLEAGGSDRFVEPLMRRFEGKRLAEIGQLELDAAARALYPKASPETRNRQVYTPFIAIWTKAAARGLCDARRWERPRMVAPPRQRWATPAEVAALADAAAPHLQPLVVFLAYTGARMAEALELDWEDVDLAAAWVVFRRTKRGEPRGVPLHPAAVVALANLRHRDGRVFRTDDGRPYRDNSRLAGGQAKTAWAGMARRSGIRGVTPHTLRHTFSTWLTAAGVTERVRDELMGHASSDTGRRYAHVPRTELVAAVAKLPSIRAVSEHEARPAAPKLKRAKGLR